MKSQYAWILIGCVFTAGFVLADGEAEPAARGGRWSFGIAPSYRHGMDTKLSGPGDASVPSVAPASPASPATPGQYDNGYVSQTDGRYTPDWSGDVQRDSASGYYALYLTRSETTETSLDSVSPASGTADERGLGVTLRGAYDFPLSDSFSIGLQASFGAWWDMEQRFAGGRGGVSGVQSTIRYMDTYLFSSELPYAVGGMLGEPEPQPGDASVDSAYDSRKVI